MFEGLAAVAKLQQDQSSYLEVMVQSIRQAYCEPIVAFAQARASRAQKAVAAAEQARHEASAATWSFLCTSSSAGHDAARKVEEEAAAATRRAEAARFDAVRLLNEAELSKRAELGERLCGVYYALRAYGQQMHLSVSRLEATTRALQAAAAQASTLEKERAVVWRQLAAAMHSELGRAFTTSGQARAGVTERRRMPGAVQGKGKAGSGKGGEAGAGAGEGTGKPRMTGGIGVGDGAGLDEAGGDIPAGPLDLVNEVVESVAARVREQLEEDQGPGAKEGEDGSGDGGGAAAASSEQPPSSGREQGRGSDATSGVSSSASAAVGPHVTPLSPGLTRAAVGSLASAAPSKPQQAAGATEGAIGARGPDHGAESDSAGSAPGGPASGSGSGAAASPAAAHASNSMTGGDASRADLGGWLYKRSSRPIGVRRADWQRRWFFVDKGALWYVRGEKDLNPVKVLDMVVGNVRSSDEADASSPAHDVRFCFEIRTPGERVFYLQAPSARERQKWVSGLRRESEKQLLAAKRASTSRRAGTDAGAAGDGSDGSVAAGQGQSASGSGGSGGDTASGRGNLANDPRVRAIQEANPRCCDCGAERPDWCSLNLGVLLCIACSGVHRSLGTHLSKVRSLTLDALEPRVLEVLEAVGNDAFNAVWEGSTQEGWQRPGPKAPREERERFIRAKYEWKGFVNVPSLSRSIARRAKGGDPSGGSGLEYGAESEGGGDGDLGGGAGPGAARWGGGGGGGGGSARDGEGSPGAKSSAAVAQDQKELAKSALAVAARASRTGDLEALLECAAAGADFEQPVEIIEGQSATTALHEAARGGHAVVAEWLLQNGARADVPDGERRLPAAVGESAGHAELAAMIRARQ